MGNCYDCVFAILRSNKKKGAKISTMHLYCCERCEPTELGDTCKGYLKRTGDMRILYKDGELERIDIDNWFDGKEDKNKDGE